MVDKNIYEYICYHQRATENYKRLFKTLSKVLLATTSWYLNTLANTGALVVGWASDLSCSTSASDLVLADGHLIALNL